MPYEIRKDAKECSGYGVYKEGTNKIYGCHKTKEAAERQMKALYAVEDKIIKK